MTMKDIPELAVVRSIEVPVQSMMVNGQEQVVMGKAFVLCCPICGTIIRQFDAGIPLVEILKALNTADEEQLKSTVHCVKCGRSLHVMRPAPIDSEDSLVKAEQNNEAKL